MKCLIGVVCAAMLLGTSAQAQSYGGYYGPSYGYYGGAPMYYASPPVTYYWWWQYQIVTPPVQWYGWEQWQTYQSIQPCCNYCCTPY